MRSETRSPVPAEYKGSVPMGAPFAYRDAFLSNLRKEKRCSEINAPNSRSCAVNHREVCPSASVPV